MDARWRSWRRDLTRTVTRHRRVLAALAAALAALSALTVVRPDPPATEPVAVAAADLPSGTRLSADLVGTVRLPAAAVPDGAYRPGDVPLGRLVAGPLRRGQPLTDAAVVGPGLAAGLPADEVLASVSVPAATGWLVRPGDVVDVVAGNARGAEADVVAANATVIAVPPAPVGDQVQPLVLAVDDASALAVSQAELVAPLDLLVRSA